MDHRDGRDPVHPPSPDHITGPVSPRVQLGMPFAGEPNAQPLPSRPKSSPVRRGSAEGVSGLEDSRIKRELAFIPRRPRSRTEETGKSVFADHSESLQVIAREGRRLSIGGKVDCLQPPKEGVRLYTRCAAHIIGQAFSEGTEGRREQHTIRPNCFSKLRLGR